MQVHLFLMLLLGPFISSVFISIKSLICYPKLNNMENNMSDADYCALFGKKLAEVRREKGIAQDKLALKCDIARSFVGEVERGKRNLSLKNIYKLAVGLGVSTADLLALVDEDIAKNDSSSEVDSSN